jgi:plastocyanin
MSTDMNNRFKKLIVSAAVAGALLLNVGGIAVAQSWEDDPTLVPMFQNTFLRTELYVASGTTVSWVNWDSEAHDVVERNALLFMSPIMNTGDVWQLTFDTPGVYQYVCDLHANMEATVIVDGAAPTAAPNDYGY